MRLIFRLIVWLLLAAAALGALGLALGWYLAGRSLPDYSAQWKAEGLARPVEITRDHMAVPHISAETDADAFFGLGWAHAQDRLWQMEMSRRAAKGRMAELFGPDMLPLDLTMRGLDIAGAAQRAAAVQTPETRALLGAYAAGVNARIRAVNEGALGRGAPEFFLFGEGRLAPWTVEDSIAVGKLMALRMSGAAGAEARRAQLEAMLPAALLRDALPESPASGSRPVGASNAWALTGGRTAAGAPLLAADPHLWLSAPDIWFLARLESPLFNVIGATIPGVPAILMGRNPDFAWGSTTAGVDDQDIYLEEIDPRRPSFYRTPSGWAEFETREEVIPVAGDGERRIVMRRGRHGPILPAGAELDFSAIASPGHVVALSWTGLVPEDRSLDAYLGLMRARSVEEGAAALAPLTAPAQNVVMADRRGVGMALAGWIPARSPDSRSRGRVPSLGRYAENDWAGPLDISAARNLRPISGLVANANGPDFAEAFPAHLSFDWPAPYRARRLENRLEERRIHSLESFAEIQQDVVSETARSVLPLIARELWWGETAEEGAVARRRAAALEKLADWNGAMTAHDPEPLIFNAWMRHLTRRLAEDEFGAVFPLFAGPRPLFVERVFHNVDGASRWCDVVKTPRTENCADIARRALDDALVELTERFGDRMENWRWGEAHRAIRRHTPLGYTAGLGLLVNIEHESDGGGDTLLMGATPGMGPWPDENTHAQGFRMVVDFADPNASLMSMPTGQSGHPLSRHYDDFGQIWRRGDYVRMSLDPADTRAGSLGTTTLTPP